jgi:hypothetical protein
MLMKRRAGAGHKAEAQLRSMIPTVRLLRRCAESGSDDGRERFQATPAASSAALRRSSPSRRAPAARVIAEAGRGEPAIVEFEGHPQWQVRSPPRRRARRARGGAGSALGSHRAATYRHVRSGCRSDRVAEPAAAEVELLEGLETPCGAAHCGSRTTASMDSDANWFASRTSFHVERWELPRTREVFEVLELDSARRSPQASDADPIGKTSADVNRKLQIQVSPHLFLFGPPPRPTRFRDESGRESLGCGLERHGGCSVMQRSLLEQSSSCRSSTLIAVITSRGRPPSQSRVSVPTARRGTRGVLAPSRPAPTDDRRQGRVGQADRRSLQVWTRARAQRRAPRAA